VRVGYRGQLRGFLLSPALAHRAEPRSDHLVPEYLDLLDPDLEIAGGEPRLDVADDWAAEQLGRVCRQLPARFIAIAPGAIYGPAKAWPAASYREAALALRLRAGLPVVLVGTREEEALGDAIRAGAEGIVNWCGTTDLAGLVAVLSRADLLVSNDSGAMHLMAALNRPQVAIFGSTSPVWTGPINPWAEVVSRNEPCAPCFARTCRHRHAACLKKLEPARVVEAALGLLGRWAAGEKHPVRSFLPSAPAR
jgi:heptosyltransferase-2